MENNLLSQNSNTNIPSFVLPEIEFKDEFKKLLSNESLFPKSYQHDFQVLICKAVNLLKDNNFIKEAILLECLRTIISYRIIDNIYSNKIKIRRNGPEDYKLERLCCIAHCADI